MLDVEKIECDDKNVDWNKVSQMQILSENFIEIMSSSFFSYL